MLSKLKMTCSLLGIFLTVNGCDGWILEVPQLVPKGSKGELVVLTVNSPLSFRKDHEHSNGYEHDLLTEFARDRGYSLRFKILKDEWAVVKGLRDGEGDIAAARIPAHYSIRGSTDLGPAYGEQHLGLICSRNIKVKTTLTGSLSTKANLKVATLRKNMGTNARNQFSKKYSNIQLDDYLNISTAQLLRLVSQGKYDCAISDRWEASLYLRFFTSLREVVKLDDGQPYHFLVSANSNSKLKLNNELSYWFQKAARRGELGRIHHRYFGYLGELTSQDSSRFFRSVGKEFKLYRESFKKFAKEFNLPWQLVAAVAYQESHWQAGAESHTGVEGLMQLTRETAEHLGVDDRRDPIQSIWGGAKYLRYLIDSQPSKIAFRERLSLALAAYNSGPAHLLDAQTLALNKGTNRLSWKDLKSVYPLLADPSYESELQYGPARGDETVNFVDRVLNFYDLLSLPI